MDPVGWDGRWGGHEIPWERWRNADDPCPNLVVAQNSVVPGPALTADTDVMDRVAAIFGVRTCILRQPSAAAAELSRRGTNLYEQPPSTSFMRKRHHA